MTKTKRILMAIRIEHAVNDKLANNGYKMDKKKARIALRKSIKHWCLDIRRPILNNDWINPFTRTWGESGALVKMCSESCELCNVYEDNCEKCPLVHIGQECQIQMSSYWSFCTDLDLNAANIMIKTLVTCYHTHT